MILFVAFGLVLGLLARPILAGARRMGVVTTSAIGLSGALLGGSLVALVTDERVATMNTAQLLGSGVGALLLLYAATTVLRRVAF